MTKLKLKYAFFVVRLREFCEIAIKIDLKSGNKLFVFYEPEKQNLKVHRLIKITKRKHMLC